MGTVWAAALLIAAPAQGWTGEAPKAAAAQAGAVAQRGSGQSLAPGEVLLELGAMGTESSPADLAEINVSVKGGGKTEQAARAEHEAVLNRVKEAARAAGLAVADIEAGQVDAGPDPEAGMMIDLTEPMRPLRPGATAEATEEAFAATSSVKLRVRAIDQVETVLADVKKAGGEIHGSPQYSAQDTTAARREARRKAVVQARADAESYAAALNMRVARISRVTERTGMDMMTMMLSEMGGGAASMSKMFEAEDGQVPAIVFVGIDFVLAPR